VNCAPLGPKEREAPVLERFRVRPGAIRNLWKNRN